MKAKQLTISATQPSAAGGVPSRSRRPVRVAVAAVAAVVALGACTSDPGPRRVALDIIQAEAEKNGDLDAECFEEAVKDFTDDQLSKIASDLESSNSEQQEAGREALDEYEAALDACSN